MWVAMQDLPRTAAHPFHTRLNQILDEHDFDGYVEGLCERFYADEGRPRAAAGPLRPPAADRVFRRLGCRARDCAEARQSLYNLTEPQLSNPHLGSRPSAISSPVSNCPEVLP